MKRLTQTLAFKASLAATLALLAPHGFAAGVLSGEVVENIATVGYQVGGVDQTAIESSPSGNSTAGAGQGAVTDFTVDRVIDLTLVQDGSVNTTVNPGEANVVTAFLLTNDSNADQGYTFAAADLANGTAVNAGPTDSLDLTTYQVFVDANANGTYEPATDTATTVATLAPDAQVAVFVVGTLVPLSATDGQVANVELTATSVEPNTTTSPTNSATNGEDVEDTLIRNLTDAARDGYIVEAAALLITKAQETISDGISAAAPFFNIPGAVIRYTITIANTGTEDASAVQVSDTIAAELDVTGSTTVTIDNDGTVTSCTVDLDNSDGCSRVDNDGGTPADPSDDTSDLTINPGITVAAGTTATVSFEVTIR